MLEELSISSTPWRRVPRPTENWMFLYSFWSFGGHTILSGSSVKTSIVAKKSIWRAVSVSIMSLHVFLTF